MNKYFFELERKFQVRRFQKYCRQKIGVFDAKQKLNSTKMVLRKAPFFRRNLVTIVIITSTPRQPMSKF
jgi:hypothetical protein